MNPSPWKTKRRMVPRWRSLAATLQSFELSAPANKVSRPQPDEAVGSDLLTRLERWRLSPTLITAAELVEACIVEGRESEGVNAARRLVSVDKNAAPLIREQAARLLARTGHDRDIPPDLAPAGMATKSVRAMTRIHPHDPLAWVELALCQTIRGASSAAERSMLVALDLAPNNRHVLRSAARLFLHRDDPERALATIARSAATPDDPWLLASEIALAQVADLPSRFLKKGNAILATGTIHPRQLTELAGAIATEELMHGNRKKSRRWFVQSMLDPTGSSLAQGEWATTTLGGELVTEAKLEMAFENAEAKAFYLFRHRRLSEVEAACNQWSGNDPFSIRPLEFGSVAASYIEDFETSMNFAQRGLDIRPRSAVLLNALAFAAGSLDHVDKAIEAITKLRSTDADRPQRLVAIANCGLIAFRQGNVEAGRLYYAEAIEGFHRDGAHEMAARAKIYLAREAMLALTLDWRALLKEAQDAMSKHKESDAMPSLQLVERKAIDIHESSAPQKPRPENSGSLSKVPNVSVSVTFNQGPRSARLGLPATEKGGAMQ